MQEVCFILWLGEKITDKGVGNGISFHYPRWYYSSSASVIVQEFISEQLKDWWFVMFLFEMLFLLFVIAGAILLVQGTRKVPCTVCKKYYGNKQYGGARQYIPLKVNAANVMPIIFAQAIMFIPISILLVFKCKSGIKWFWAAFMIIQDFGTI